MPTLKMSSHVSSHAPQTGTSSPRPRTLNFITGNANKLNEVRMILCEGSSAVPGLTLESRDVPELVEIQGSVEEIATDKARRAAELVSFFYFTVCNRGLEFFGSCLAIL